VGRRKRFLTVAVQKAPLVLECFTEME
jgi:hypothetical protein